MSILGRPAREETQPDDHLIRAIEHLSAVLASAGEGSDLTWVGRVQLAARSVEQALVNHRDVTEGEGGALARLLEQKAALQQEVTNQVAEHAELIHRAASFVTACEKERAFQEANVEINRLDGQILGLMVRRHLAWESALSFEAFFRDEGGEG